MTKAAKKAVAKKRGEYDEKLSVKGSFIDIINAAVKHTKENTPKRSPKIEGYILHINHCNSVIAGLFFKIT